MGDLERAWQVAGQRQLFEEIHRFKVLYEQILSEVANRLMASEVAKGLPGFRGCKVSKGNELERCPYQVLDVGRDFDSARGLNIRVLNWWGRGAFVFLFAGTANPLYTRIWEERVLGTLKSNGYRWADADSLWHYKQILDDGNHRALSPAIRLKVNSDAGRFFQVFCPVKLEGEKSDAEAALFECVYNLISLLQLGTLD
ncbi:MAG: hypothetical protein JJU34_08010 [Lunatimonas sp.]|uniref:hypothetical protein n=1 Tax=Lunatimonas sp. TaxID=2060141 RepID=UPI00263B3CAF|nr:hypothetical protein [Lunatimonas sp.]MCC5937212.1 hypothetical protein [Lunatimonas sp.]